MVKQWLVEDGPSAGGTVTTGLDDDGCAAVAAPPPREHPDEPFPVLTVMARSRTGFDDDGSATFDWTTLLVGPAVVWTEREEFDADAGFTEEKASTTVVYHGEATVSETVAVFSDDGRRWRVTSVDQPHGLLTMEMVRVVDDAG